MDHLYGCENCRYFERVLWLGDARYVICPKLPGGKSKDVKMYRGCGDFQSNDISAARQTTLF